MDKDTVPKGSDPIPKEDDEIPKQHGDIQDIDCYRKRKAPGGRRTAPDSGDGPSYTVGLTYNLKKGIISEIEDAEAEYDSFETILAIKGALERLNCRVELLEADAGLFEKLRDTKVDIVFNIAEGLHGRGREAQVPAILNFFRIPFVGSDETTLCVALDKALTKRVLASHGIKTPRYQVIFDTSTKIRKHLRFPLIVKPNAEGSSKGVSELSVVEDCEQLQRVIDRNFRAYNQAMLVEEFISGREFTVGIVGNGSDMVVFPPMEISYKDREQKNNIYSYNVKKNYKEYIEYSCPPCIDARMEENIRRMAGKIYRVLECRDFSRIDFRMSDDGELYFIEINPLPGLAPGYSDYPMLAEFSGVGYNSLIGKILDSALKRYGMKPLFEKQEYRARQGNASEGL